MLSRVRFGAAVVAAGLLLTGCAPANKVIKTEGTITLDNKPLSGASIQLISEKGGPPASGTSGTDGSFRLTTWSTGDGALPGEYKIVITLPPEKDEAGRIDPNDPKSTMEAMRKHSMEMKKPSAAAEKKKAKLPANYGDATKTPLKQVIPAPDGKITLDLRSSGA